MSIIKTHSQNEGTIGQTNKFIFKSKKRNARKFREYLLSATSEVCSHIGVCVRVYVRVKESGQREAKYMHFYESLTF